MMRPSPDRTTTVAPPPGVGRGRWRVYVEDALILLAIPVLWLTLFRMEGSAARTVQIVTLCVMLAVMAVRLRRLWAARREAEDEARKL